MKKITKAIYFCLLPALIAGACTKNPLEQYNDLIGSFLKENKTDMQALTGSFLRAFSTQSFESEDLFINRNVVIAEKEGKTFLVYPEKIELDVDKNFISRIDFADMRGNFIAVGNSRGFCVLNKEGKAVSAYRCEGEDKIEDLVLHDSSVIFFRNQMVEKFSVAEGKSRILVDHRFTAPYKKYYKAALYNGGGRLGICTGIAGSYYISVVGCSNHSVVIENVASSSGEFAVSGSSLYCIKGNAGAWSLYRYDLNSKKSERLKGSGNIENIYIGQEGYIVNRGSVNELVMYDGRSLNLPFQSTVGGVCRSEAVFKHGNTVYVVPFQVLFEKLSELKSKGLKVDI